MSILENRCLTPVNVYGTVYDMNTTDCHCPDGHDTECPHSRCPGCGETFPADTAEKIRGLLYCSGCAHAIQGTPHTCWWCKESFAAREMVNDGMWKCWPCYRAERGLEARDCDGINAQTGALPTDPDYFNYGRGR